MKKTWVSKNLTIRTKALYCGNEVSAFVLVLIFLTHDWIIELRKSANLIGT